MGLLLSRLEDFITIFNYIGAKEAKSRFAPIVTGEEYLGDTGLDSMDFLILSLYLCTWFGVDNEIAKQLHPLREGETASAETGAIATGKDFFAFLEHHKTQEMPSVEDCVKDYG